MKNTGLLLFIVLFFCACGEEKPPLTVHQQAIKEEGFTPDTLCGEYRRYTGTVAGQQVVLHYMQYGDRVVCQYYYQKHGKNISMYNTTDTPHENPLVFVERSETDRMSDGGLATWEVSINDDSMKGEWISPDRELTYPVLLKENFSEGVQQFSIVCLSDSISLTDSMSEPFAHAEYQVLLPVGNDETARFVRNTLYGCIGCDSVEGDDMKSCLDGLKAKYFADYRNVNDEEGKYHLNGNSFNNWEEQTNLWVVYNEDGIVVLNHHVYSYTGGAHGNSSSNYLCIDAVQKKVLELEDIIRPDTARLVKLLDRETRKLYRIGDDEPLYEYILADELYIPEQFYISNKGITFVYGIYEVAPYADGEVNLFIPYNKIMDLLTPYFKQRMKLEQVALNK